MKIIGAGFGRTGTASLKTALEQLGFGPCYHMFDVLAEPWRSSAWHDAAGGGAVDWHAVFNGYEATVDWPGCAFVEELTTAFPDAQVILTVRDPAAWYDSMTRTIQAVYEAAVTGRLSGAGAPPDAGIVQMIDAVLWQRTFGGRFADRAHAMDVLARHIEAVRAIVPADRLLVHEIADGWPPLAGFLSVAVPDTPFPRLNDADSFRRFVGLPALIPSADA